MAGKKKLDGAIKKFVNQLASNRAIPYREKDLEEMIVLFKEIGLTLNIIWDSSEVTVVLLQKGKVIRERMYYWDVEPGGKTSLLFDDLI